LHLDQDVLNSLKIVIYKSSTCNVCLTALSYKPGSSGRRYVAWALSSNYYHTVSAEPGPTRCLWGRWCFHRQLSFIV